MLVRVLPAWEANDSGCMPAILAHDVQGVMTVMSIRRDRAAAPGVQQAARGMQVALALDPLRAGELRSLIVHAVYVVGKAGDIVHVEQAPALFQELVEAVAFQELCMRTRSTSNL